MSPVAPEVLDPTSTYLHLPEGPGVRAIPVTDDFWSTIDERAALHRGRLVTSFDQSADWTVWEMHPEDDEIIVQVSGETTFHVDVRWCRDEGPGLPGSGRPGAARRVAHGRRPTARSAPGDHLGRGDGTPAPLTGARLHSSV
jgi:hypothetical protein